MPIFVDQPHNSIRQQHHGYGRHLGFWTFTSDQLSAVIRDVIADPMYKEAIMKSSRVFHSRRMNARETAAYWTDHVVQHGGRHLRSHAYDMPFYQFWMLDLLGVVVVCCTIVLFMFVLVLRCLFRMCCSKKVPTASRQKMDKKIR